MKKKGMNMVRHKNILILATAAIVMSNAGAFAAFVPEGLGEGVVAFYPMAGYESGTRWTVPAGQELVYTNYGYYAATALLTNAVDGAYQIRPYISQYGYVTVTNETPGRYLFANSRSKAPMAESFMSLQPVTVAQVPGKYGTFMTIDNFGKMMAEVAESTHAFTIEMFVKPCSEKCVGTFFWFDIGPSDGRYRVTVQIVSTNTKTIRAVTSSKVSSTNYRSDIVLDADARDSRWHHVAVVYEQPDENADGYVTLYYDYKKASSVAYVKRDLAGGGIRIADNASVADGWPGLFSAIRVSNSALEPDDMLHVSDEVDGYREDKTIGFYPFDDQPPGTVFGAGNCDSRAAGASRIYWSGAFSNRAETTGYACSGKSVQLGVVLNVAGTDPDAEMYSTNDVPARYVYSGVNATSPLRELKSSLCDLGYANVGTANKSGYVAMLSLAQALFEEESYTVEFFAKFLSVPSIFSFFDQGPSEQNRFMLRQDTTSSLRADFTLRKDGASTTTRSVVSYPDLASFVDGRWHHVALVYDGESATLYCDYTLVGNSISISRGASIADGAAFRLAEGLQWAHYSCLRATAKALEPQEFLYASDSADGVLAGADWNWRLEGDRGSGVASATSVGAALDADQYIFKDTHGFAGGVSSGGSLAYEKAFLGGRRILGGVEDGRNLSSAAVSGSYLYSGLTGPLCAPGRVFTAEALVKGAAPASGMATVFGAENLVGASVWNLAIDSSGALVLNYTLQDGTVATEKAMDAFADAAHHVALVADFPNRSIKVYADYVERLSVVSSEPLSTDGLRFVAAGGCGQSTLSGSIDEIRLTHDALTVSSFEKMEKPGYMLIFR